MPGRVQGKRVLITGGARGQGRAHAIRLAQEGAAQVVLVDALVDYPELAYHMATTSDLEVTAQLVEQAGSEAVARVVDVRDRDAVRAVAAEHGPFDIVVANAGICPGPQPFWTMPPEEWNNVFDVNVRGVWSTVSAAVPGMIEAELRGSIIVTGSVVSYKGARNASAYAASKHAVLGLVRSMALDLAPYFIRVNAVCPTSVDTDLINNEGVFRRFRPDLENPTREDMVERYQAIKAMPLPWIEPVDVANAVLWLATEESRYVTGIALPVDLGASVK
jgi:SDR family mycofactocin-dependent oxidoreductase